MDEAERTRRRRRRQGETCIKKQQEWHENVEKQDIKDNTVQHEDIDGMYGMGVGAALMVEAAFLLSMQSHPLQSLAVGPQGRLGT